MSTIAKIIIAIETVYILTILLMINTSDLSWEVNKATYYKIIASSFLIVIQFVKRRNKK